MMKGISIVIPVYNEEVLIKKNTRKVIKYLKKLKYPFEIIIINNGSTDQTVKLGEELEKENKGRVKFISLDKKGVVGTAFAQGIKTASYDYIISLDMDLSVELNFVKKATELLHNNHMVIGSKQVGNQDRQLIRIFASFVYIFLVRLFLNLEYTDYSMSAKAFRRESIIKYADRIDKGSAYIIELTYWLAKQGKKIKEIPVKCFDKRKSKFSLVGESLYRFRSLINLWLFKKIE